MKELLQQIDTMDTMLMLIQTMEGTTT